MQQPIVRAQELPLKKLPVWVTPEKKWADTSVPLFTKTHVQNAPSKSIGVLQVFLNQDLRNSHLGLAEVAKKGGVDVSALKPGQYVIFMNAMQNRVKLFAASNIVAYAKSPEGGRIDLRYLCEIPKAFNGGAIDYDAAAKQALIKAFARRGKSLET